MHNHLISITGGTKGIKDYSTLDYCVKSPFSTFDGIDLYPSNVDKIVTLSFKLIKKHPFCDGNKRIGMHILILGLKLNNIEFELSNQDIIRLGLGVASNEISKEHLLKFINQKINI